jgi:2-dehydro-3-deoxyphosphogalactonate aldolase
VDTGNMQAYWEHGATGFGIGSALYKPGVTAGEIKERAGQFLGVVRGLPAKLK